MTNPNQSNKSFGFIGIFFLGILLICLETLAYVYGGIFARSAAIVWFMLGGLYLTLSLMYVIKTIFHEVHKFYFGALFVLGFLILVILFGTGFNTLINRESTIQLSEAFHNIQQYDFGYTKTGFIGYPSRQYYIYALPSILLGKQIWSLNLGFVYPLFLGCMLFYAGIKTLSVAKNAHHHYIPLILTLSIFLFPYVLPFSLHFEQSIMPLAMSLHAISWVIKARFKPHILDFLCLMWIGTTLGTMYTPAYASWLLMIIACATFCITSFQRRLFNISAAWTISGVVTAIYGILALQSMIKVENGLELNTLLDSSTRILSGFSVFFSLHSTRIFIGPLLYLPIIVYILSSLIGKNGRYHMALMLWICAVVISSVIMRGYANPPPELAIHRSMIIIPPLLIGFYLWIVQFVKFNAVKGFPILIILLLLACYIRLSINPNLLRLDPKDAGVIITRDMMNTFRDSPHKSITDKSSTVIHALIISKDMKTASVYDMTRFFFPRWTVAHQTVCVANLSENSSSLNIKTPDLVYVEDPDCLSVIVENYTQGRKTQVHQVTIPTLHSYNTWHRVYFF